VRIHNAFTGLYCCHSAVSVLTLTAGLHYKSVFELSNLDFEFPSDFRIWSCTGRRWMVLGTAE